MSKHETAVAIPPADTIPVQARPTLAYRAVRRFFLKPVLHTLFNIKVTGRKNLKLPAGSYVAVANHTSWVDGVLLMSVLPPKPRPHFMGDPSTFIQMGKLVWWGVRKIGGLICVDRTNHGDPVLRRQAIKCLEVGAVLGLFPEGRFVRLPGEPEEGLLPFKKGFAHFAVEGGNAPVIPIAINGARTLWFRKRVEVIVGAPIPTEGKSVDAIVAETRAAMEAMVQPEKPSTGLQLLRDQLTIRRKPSAGTYATLASPPREEVA